MTVATTANRQSYNGDDATIEFVFTFKAFEASDIKVVVRSALGVETTLTLDTDYTVAVLATTGGTVTLIGTYAATPPATGETVTVYRDLPYTQEIDPVENDPQRADVAEEGLDRAVILIQQLKDAMSRSIQLPVSTAVSDLSLPEPEAAKYLGWNDDGDALENRELISSVGVSSFMAGMLDDTSAAAALTTLGLGQGTANHKLFMNAAGTAPEWALGNFSGIFTRSTTTASGDQVISGLPFKPSAILFVGCISGLAGRMAVAFAGGGSAAFCGIWDAYNTLPNAWYYSGNGLIFRQGADSGHEYTGVISSISSDSFTITWTKAASAIEGETITVNYLMWR
jgi:hypothetical protein